MVPVFGGEKQQPVEASEAEDAAAIDGRATYRRKFPRHSVLYATSEQLPALI